MSYQEYPRMVYGPEDTKIVNTNEEKSAALKAGYALLPPTQAQLPPPGAEAKMKKKPAERKEPE